MQRKVKPIPPGYHTVTPYLSVNGAASAIDFYKKAFAAEEIFRMPGPGGTIGHAEIQIGDSRIMLADESPDTTFRAPHSFGGTSVHMHLYVQDVDRVVKKCVADDVKPGKHTSFPQSVKLKAGETVIFAYIVYKSRAQRDRVNAKVMKDPRLAKSMDPKAMPFDGKRMFWGGFKVMLAL